MNDRQTTVLLIEDNPGDARLVQEALTEAAATSVALQSFTVIRVERLSDGLRKMDEHPVDVVLLDLTLPDGQGLDLLSSVQKQAPQVPVLILTGLDDEAIAIRAIQVGAQDYLIKGRSDNFRLARALLYAIERKQSLALADRVRQLERELHALEQLSATVPTSVTAKSFGMLPVREQWPERFDQFVARYSHILDMAMEEQAFRVSHQTDDKLQGIADGLGFLKAGPRDVIEIHQKSLQASARGQTQQKTQAYLVEGRILVLRLMGYLVNYYRNHAGNQNGKAQPAATVSGKGEGA